MKRFVEGHRHRVCWVFPEQIAELTRLQSREIEDRCHENVVVIVEIDMSGFFTRSLALRKEGQREPIGRKLVARPPSGVEARPTVAVPGQKEGGHADACKHDDEDEGNLRSRQLHLSMMPYTLPIR